MQSIGSWFVVATLCSAGCASQFERGGVLHYPHVSEEEIHAAIPTSGGEARTAYLEAHRECAGIFQSYRAQAQSVRDASRSWMIGLGIGAIALGTLTGVTASAAAAESTQRELILNAPQPSSTALRASIDRENALTWTAGVSGGVSGVLEVATVMVWLSDARGDTYAEAASGVREAINESDRTVTDADEVTPELLRREASLLRRRCRQPHALVVPLAPAADPVSPAPTR